jgi:hypothetical protein
MKHVPPSLSIAHPDFALISVIQNAIFESSGGFEQFAEDVPLIIRRAIDEVIDSPRTNRFTLTETEKTEKTYLGTKIEILLRNYLKFPKGKVLDLSIKGIEVDIKNTIGRSWTIPQEAVGQPCILVQSNERTALCSVGIIVAEEAYLNLGKNRDGKRSISAAGAAQIHWLINNTKYPPNFWEAIAPELRDAIMAPRGGSDRVANLFLKIQGKPISRLLVQSVGQQDDYMKRVRRNGGARDILAPKGVAILWGKKDREIIERLKLVPCTADEFISFQAVSDEDRDLLRAAGHID